MLSRMLVANDGSPGGGKALKYALELARRLEIGVTMICVEELRFPASIEEVAEAQEDAKSVFDKVVASAKTLAGTYGVTLDAHVVPGHPLPSIVDFVRKNGYTCSSSVSWATPRSTIASSVARPTVLSSTRRAR
jgi:nucleotide-binding universal stress UspA family protein